MHSIVATLGYVVRDGKVLLVHRSRAGDDHQGKYNGLGGKLEPGEDIVTCLHRELMEEAGITVTNATLRGTISWPGFGSDGSNWFGFIFLITGFEGEVPQRNDDGPLGWFDVEELPGLPMWDGDRYFLPLVFDDDPRQFHAVHPYLDGTLQTEQIVTTRL